MLKAAIDDDKPFESVTKKIDGITSSVTNLFGGSEKKENKPAPSLVKSKFKECASRCYDLQLLSRTRT